MQLSVVIVYELLLIIIPDDGLGIKTETLDFDETDLFQLLMIDKSINGWNNE